MDASQGVAAWYPDLQVLQVITSLHTTKPSTQHKGRAKSAVRTNHGL